MYYTIYKITNKINGFFYIGKHQTKNLNDNYYGSGVRLKKAIKKYGIENFTKELLFVFDSEEEMNNYEKQIVNENFLLSNNTYNIAIGGEGGPHFLNKKHSENIKMQISKSLTGKRHSKETKKKISEANKRRIITDSFREKMSKPRRPMSEETKKKISETRKRLYAD